MSDFVKQSVSIIGFKTSESWIITNSVVAEIKKKVEEVGTPLEEWNINFYRGILTGCNDAFIIDSKKRADLIKEDPKSAEIIRPILRGKDIKRYQCNFANLWLIAAHNGLQEQNIKRVDINEYPAIKKHLDKFYDTISVRDDQGDTPYNLRSCAYMDDFSKPKIVYPRINQKASFIYDTKGFICLDSSFFIVGENIEFLIAFLNSKLFDFCFRENFAQLGQKGRDFRKEYIIKIPVIQISRQENEWYKNKILQLQNYSQNSDEKMKIEDEIDSAIYSLYNLTKNEIISINSAFEENVCN